MKTTGGTSDQKRRAGESAAETVTDGMVIGLGTGSTAAHAIRALGRAVDAGLDVRGVATSFASRELARECAIPLLSLEDAISDDGPGIQVAIDGADQIAGGEEHASPASALIKGGGAAHAREKIVDTAAERFLVVADPSKEVETLNAAVPVEVLPAAHTTVSKAVRELGGIPKLRRAERKDGPVVTDNGNLVLDCDVGTIDDPNRLANSLATIPGVVEHGLFIDLADEIHVGTSNDVRVWTP